MEEIWAVVKICPDYEVSNLGNVRSVDRYVTFPACKRAKGYSRFYKGKTVHPFVCKSTGYLQIRVKKKNAMFIGWWHLHTVKVMRKD